MAMLIHRFLCPPLSFPAKTCLSWGSQRLTYRQLAEQTDEMACCLATQIKPKDIVLIKLARPLEQLLYFFAVIKAGGICLLADATTSDELCAHLIQSHNIRLCIDSHYTLPAKQVATLPPALPQDCFLGALSSGTTGTPKIIWRSHTSWVSAFAAQSRIFKLSGADTLYLAGSLVYTANLNACLHLLAEGGTVVFASSGMPRTWVQEITDRQISALFMVPANYKRLLSALRVPLPAITSLVTAGAKMDLATLKRLPTYFPSAQICEYYGASELGHVSYLLAEDILAHPAAVGRAFPGVTITIKADQTIWVKSPYLAPAYQPEASVGDLGELDENGFLYLWGRKNGLINTGGVKVIPEQVEQVLLTCPGVVQACVAGVSDALRGEKIYAWLVAPSLTTAQVLDFCHRQLLPHCHPQRIIFIQEMPLTTTGKIDRQRLRATCT